MKKLIIVSMAILFALFNSCSNPFDDSYLMDRIDELTERIEALEDFSDQVQSDIDALQDIIIKLQSAVTVDNIVFGADSYTIKFSDGSSITITDGKDGQDGEDGRDGQDGQDGQDGEDGKDGMTPPTIIVIEEDGVYYWGYENPDGSKEFILDNDGNKIPVTAAAPEVRINPDTGNWEISTDGGQTWKDTGMPSVGIGDSLFLDIMEDDDNVYLVLRDGSVIVIPKTKEFSFELDITGESLDFTSNQTIVIGYRTNGAENIVITKPDGWKASVKADGIEITAPSTSKGNEYVETEGQITVIAISTTGQSIMRVINVGIKTYFDIEIISITPVSPSEWTDEDKPQYEVRFKLIPLNNVARLYDCYIISSSVLNMEKPGYKGASDKEIVYYLSHDNNQGYFPCTAIDDCYYYKVEAGSSENEYKAYVDAGVRNLCILAFGANMLDISYISLPMSVSEKFSVPTYGEQPTNADLDFTCYHCLGSDLNEYFSGKYPELEQDFYIGVQIKLNQYATGYIGGFMSPDIKNEPKDLIIYHILESNSHHNGDGKFLYYYDGNTEFGGFALISGTFVFVAYDDEYNFGEPRFQDFTVTPDTAAEGATDPEEFVKLFPEFFYNLN